MTKFSVFLTAAVLTLFLMPLYGLDIVDPLTAFSGTPPNPYPLLLTRSELISLTAAILSGSLSTIGIAVLKKKIPALFSSARTRIYRRKTTTLKGR